MKCNLLFKVSFFGFFALAFYLLNFFTPLLHDDLAYLFKFGPKAEFRPTDVPVRNFKDVFESMYWHYLDVNGSITTQFLLQLLLLIGKWCFNILNTAVFVLIPILIVKYFDIQQERKIFIYLFIFLFLWFLMPFIGQTMVWMTGAIIYLWSCFFVLLFLLIQRKQESKAGTSFLENISLFVYSVITGCTNESVTIGLAAALFFYVLLHYKSMKVGVAYMILGLWLGVSLILFSPGTFNRVNNEVGSVGTGFTEILRNKILDVIAIAYLMKYQLILSLVLLGTSILLKKIDFKKFINDNLLILLTILFTAVFILLIGKLEERVFYGISFYILILNIYLLNQIYNARFYRCFIIFSVFLVLIFAYSFNKAFSFLRIYAAAYENMESKIKSDKQTIIDFPLFDKSRYVNNQFGVVSDNKNYHNRVRAFYYQVPEVSILPQNFYEDFYVKKTLITKQHILSGWNTDKIYYAKDYGVIIIEIPSDFEYKHLLSADVLNKNETVKLGVQVKILPWNDKKFAFVELDNNSQNYDRIIIKNSIHPSQKIFEYYKK